MNKKIKSGPALASSSMGKKRGANEAGAASGSGSGSAGAEPEAKRTKRVDSGNEDAGPVEESKRHYGNVQHRGSIHGYYQVRFPEERDHDPRVGFAFFFFFFFFFFVKDPAFDVFGLLLLSSKILLSTFSDCCCCRHCTSLVPTTEDRPCLIGLGGLHSCRGGPWRPRARHWLQRWPLYPLGRRTPGPVNCHRHW